MSAETQFAGEPDRTERVLGVTFFNGTAADAAAQMCAGGGLLVAPASPALLNLKYDEGYRRALQQADVALADSALLAAIWKLRSGRTLRRISGFSYLHALLVSAEFRGNDALFIVRTVEEQQKALAWLQGRGISADVEAFHVADRQGAESEDHSLLLHIEERRPRHVIVALRSGAQEKLGLYLREYLLYRPSIHCVGAALGFFTGAEGTMPRWAEERRLGWLARLSSQPGMLIPRIGIAATIAAMVLRYGSELPKLRPRWSEL